jgi:tyrosyl-tRNA synthetase
MKRKAEDGGDVEYADGEQLEADFRESKVHPGDLKPAVLGLVHGALATIQAKFKETPEGKRAEADYKTAVKALAKKK